MHADTIEEHQRLTREAREIVVTWKGTDPMRGAEDVRRALEAMGDATLEEIDALLPYVVDACEDAGLIRDPADMGALLRAAVDAYAAREGISQAEVARRAALDPASLNRSFKRPDADPRAVRAVCRALGLHVALVPDEEG